MNNTIKLVILIGISSLLLVGCGSRRIVISKPEVKRTQVNTWAQQTNEKEEVDISDITTEKVNHINRDSVSESAEFRMERVPFSNEEYNHLAKIGNATIRGTIYLKDAYNKRILGGNTRLYLNPVTSYSKQWYYESYLGGHKMQKADKRLFNYLRFTSANEQGQFAFYGVPPGEYYLIGTVKCAGACGYSVPKNVRIATQVSVRGNEIVQKELTRMID